MIQSNDYKFIFIHNAKTGGTSIHKALIGALEGTDFIKFSHPRISKYAKKPCRMFALETKNTIGYKLWEKYFTFAFVRNPWDRLVSMYVHLQSGGTDKGPLIKRIKKLDDKCLHNENQQEGFKRFVDIAIVNRDIKNYHWEPQHYMVCDKNKQVIMNHVGRFETFDDDLTFILNRVNLGSVNTPHIYKSKREHYSHYYTQGTQNIVAEYYKEDIKLFNYSF